MSKILTLLVYLWNKKAYILLPTVLFPIITLAWSLSYQPAFKAITTIGVDKRLVSSPLLKNFSTPENIEILERRLKGSSLLKDTVMDSSTFFDNTNVSDEQIKSETISLATRVQIKAIDSENFQISYTDTSKENTVRILEALSNNFIDDLLAPERLRTEEKLMNLANQVQYYSELEKKHEALLNNAQEKLSKTQGEKQQNLLLKKVVKLEFDVQKASAQKDLAQTDYEKLLIESRSLITGARTDSTNPILQYIEPPVIVSGERTSSDHTYITYLSFKIGLLVALLSLFISRLMDTTLRTDKQIQEAFGLRIIGRIPHIGEVTFKDGRLIADPTKIKL